MLFPLLLLTFLQSTAPIDGTWRATVGSHDAVIALKSCADGELIGILPAEPTISITGGTVSGSNVTLYFSGEDGGGSIGDFSFTGVLSGDVLDGQGLVDGSLLDVTFNRVTANYEVQFMEVVDPDVSPIYPEVNATLLFNIVTYAGNFISGGFVGFHTCEFIACGGMIDSVSTDRATGEHTIITTSSGVDGELRATWDGVEKTFSGTWTSINSSGYSAGGEFFGSQQGMAYSHSFDEVMGLLTTFSDGVEDETLSASDIFDTSYLNDGITLADWNARFSSWFSNYDNLQVALGSITTLITHNTGDENLWTRRLPQIETTVVVTGLNLSTGVTEIVYQFNPTAINTELSLITTSPAVKFIGNGASSEFELELPLDYSSAAVTSSNLIWLTNFLRPIRKVTLESIFG